MPTASKIPKSFLICIAFWAFWTSGGSYTLCTGTVLSKTTHCKITSGELRKPPSIPPLYFRIWDFCPAGPLYFEGFGGPEKYFPLVFWDPRNNERGGVFFLYPLICCRTAKTNEPNNLGNPRLSKYPPSISGVPNGLEWFHESRRVYTILVRFFGKEKGLLSFYFWLCVLDPNRRLIPRGHMLL